MDNSDLKISDFEDINVEDLTRMSQRVNEEVVLKDKFEENPKQQVNQSQNQILQPKKVSFKDTNARVNDESKKEIKVEQREVKKIQPPPKPVETKENKENEESKESKESKEVDVAKKSTAVSMITLFGMSVPKSTLILAVVLLLICLAVWWHKNNSNKKKKNKTKKTEEDE
uniref:Uncharacterized protein n=1 Tax=viral metagenome TaxID=1070528 RepID=A0A6C0ECF1_9ZZZZ